MFETTFPIGLQVQTSPLAVSRSKNVELARHPIRKRRRNWSIKVTWQEKPAVWQVGNHTLICHPSIYQQLVRDFATSGEKGNG